MRLRQHRLQRGLGRKNPVEFGWTHGNIAGEGEVVQIILISDRLAKARSVHMSVAHLVGTALVALVLLFGATGILMNHRSTIHAPLGSLAKWTSPPM